MELKADGRQSETALGIQRGLARLLRAHNFAHLTEFTLAAEAADGERFARCFTEDGIYYDYIYGAHRGRKEIAYMLEELFRRDADDDYRWEMFDPVINGVRFFASPTCHHTPDIYPGIGEGEASLILKDFFREKREL